VIHCLEDDGLAVAVICNTLADIAHQMNTTILLIHHTGKGFHEDPFDAPRGASSMRGTYDVGLILVRGNNEQEAVMHIEGREMAQRAVTLRQQGDAAGWEYVGGQAMLTRIRAGRQTLQAMYEHPESADGLTVKQIAAQRETTEVNVFRQLELLERDGYVEREKAAAATMGRRPDLWHLTEKGIAAVSGGSDGPAAS